ncbi:MAG: aminotransferase class V-fold PLP-dependent enzyme [Planctomycetia bacterium]|nr:aminotransferase class V-fold PLP-dependent enzyme [Planctomycetia bacterium]
MARIYLDNAATSWPKAEAVYGAVDHYQRQLGAPAGRSSYAEASDVERMIGSCRKKIATLIGATDPFRIVFTFNGTDSLNLALHGLLRPGDHVVTTVCEHNSVLRPLRFLAQRDITTTYVPCDGHGYIDADEAVGKIAADHGVFFVLDAAQSLGHVPIDVTSLGCHLLAAPGHKGLLGPLGTGVLYIAPSVEQQLLPLRQGGTGTKSDEDRQPDSLPDRYESGNLNVPGIAGLEAGVTHVQRLGESHILAHSRALVQRLLAGLTGLPGLRLYGPPSGANRVGVVSLNVAGYDPQELAAVLDANWRIQTRAGLHCAPRMHAALGTSPSGTLRLSPGHFTTQDDIDAAIAAFAEICRG